MATPTKEGHFWAMLEYHPDIDLRSVDWEVVQVFDNNGSETNGAPPFLASVPGVEGGQRLEAFKWGPEVIHPDKFAAALEKRADWLRSEYQRGGDRAHLEPREEEARAIAKMIREGRLL